MAKKSQLAEKKYLYGFHDDVENVFTSGRGLTRKLIEEISAMKGEPQWMRDFRLKSLEIFEKKPMPTWGGVLEELRATTKAGGGRPLFDEVRRKYLVALKQHTGRDVILYATKWTQPEPGLPAELVSVGEEDIQGLMEVVHGLGGDELDLILHSPGGSPEAAEAFMVGRLSR